MIILCAADVQSSSMVFLSTPFGDVNQAKAKLRKVRRASGECLHGSTTMLILRARLRSTAGHWP
jgi:hypothetical protein